MRIVEGHEKIHFSHGFFVEHTDGVFSLPNNELTIVNDRALPRIMKYLRQLHGENWHSIKLSWHEKASK